MSQITELEVVAAKITAGRKLKATAYDTSNHALHVLVRPISKALFWMFECDSNNAGRTVVPSDVSIIRAQFNYFKEELGLAKVHSNQPTANLEVAYKILLPHETEMVKFVNSKIERVAHQYFALAQVCMSLDGAATKNFIELADFTKIDKAVSVVEAIMDKFLGDGAPIKGQPGAYNTGLEVPALQELGLLKPDNDLDSAEFREGSADKPNVGLPDSEDTPAV